MSIQYTEWWNQLSTGEQFFWATAIISTTLFVLQTIMTFFGLGEEVDFDVDADFDGDFDFDGEMDFDGDIDDPGHFDISHDFRIFSVRGIVAFFTFFSWGGLLVLDAGFPMYLAIILGLIAGFLAMVFVAWALFKMHNMTEVGTEDLTLAIGLTGEAYIPIPAERQGKGKVHIIISQALREMEAVTDGNKISTGEKVIVIDILPDNTLVVEKHKAM